MRWLRRMRVRLDGVEATRELHEPIIDLGDALQMDDPQRGGEGEKPGRIQPVSWGRPPFDEPGTWPKHIHTAPTEDALRDQAKANKARWVGYSEDAAAAVLAELADLSDGLCCHNVLDGRMEDIEAARIEHALNVKDQESFRVGERVICQIDQGGETSEFYGKVVARDIDPYGLLYMVSWDADKPWPAAVRNDGTNLVHPDRVRWYDPTHGQINRDIQLHVELMHPADIGQRTAIENTLQEKLNRGERLVLMTEEI